MSQIEKLEEEVEKLKERNRRVETNKAWETSTTRKTAIILSTYLIVTITLSVLGNPDPFLNAIIPTLGFFLSTLTFPFIRSFWEKYIYKK